MRGVDKAQGDGDSVMELTDPPRNGNDKADKDSDRAEGSGFGGDAECGWKGRSGRKPCAEKAYRLTTLVKMRGTHRKVRLLG